MLFDKGIHCFAHSFIKRNPNTLMSSGGVARVASGDSCRTRAQVKEELLAQQLVLAHEFPDFEMLARPLAPLTSSAANLLMVYLDFIQLDYAENLVQDQWYGVEEQRLF
jgi:hypothetical protein